MSIEIGTKYIGEDGEVVEVNNIVETVGRDEVIYYKCKQGKEHISYDYDFLEQYKPYEVVYEYNWVQLRSGNAYETEGYYTEAHEIAGKEVDFWNGCLVAPLLKTKRERKSTTL